MCTHQRTNHYRSCQTCYIQYVCETVSTDSPAPTAPVTCVLLDRGQLLSGSKDCFVKMWDLDTGCCVGTLLHPAWVVAIEVCVCVHTPFV